MAEQRFKSRIYTYDFMVFQGRMVEHRGTLMIEAANQSEAEEKAVEQLYSHLNDTSGKNGISLSLREVFFDMTFENMNVNYIKFTPTEGAHFKAPKEAGIVITEG